MSILTDFFNLFEDESNAFAFLPALNLGYVYWKSTSPHLCDMLLLLGALLASSLAFNLLSEYNFDNFLDSDEDTMRPAIATIFAVIAIVWIGLLVISLYQLYQIYSTETVWPILLTAITLTFLMVSLTDLVLRYLPQYRPD